MLIFYFFCSDANFTKGKNTIFFFVLQYGISVIHIFYISILVLLAFDELLDVYLSMPLYMRRV